MSAMVLPEMVGGLVRAAAKALEAAPPTEWSADSVTHGRSLFHLTTEATRNLRKALEDQLRHGHESRSFVARWVPVLDNLDREAPTLSASVGSAPPDLADELRAASGEVDALRSQLREILDFVRAALAKPIDMNAVNAAIEASKGRPVVTQEQMEKMLLGE